MMSVQALWAVFYPGLNTLQCFTVVPLHMGSGIPAPDLSVCALQIMLVDSQHFIAEGISKLGAMQPIPLCSAGFRPFQTLPLRGTEKRFPASPWPGMGTGPGEKLARAP